MIDESGTAKSGDDTAGVGRQWCGRTGKVDNCTVAVHTCYATSDFHCLLDSDQYLPQSWAHDPERRKKAHIPEDVVFRTKPQVAQAQIERALRNGVRVAAWTFDEAYGRDREFLDFLDQQEQTFVPEVPVNFFGWVGAPVVVRQAPKITPYGSRGKKYRRVRRKIRACEVRDLVRYSPVFQRQKWQRFHIKDSEKGPVVWDVKWARFDRPTATGLPSGPGCLIVARNVLNPTGVKYFVANRVPQLHDETAEELSEPETGTSASAPLTWLLWVAFRRWPVEQYFPGIQKRVGIGSLRSTWLALHPPALLPHATHPPVFVHASVVSMLRRA